MDWNTHFIQKKPQSSTEVIAHILKTNRHLTDQKSIDNFISPPYPKISHIISQLNISKPKLKQVVLRIKNALKINQPIVIYGDYDVDGVCAVSYLYQALKPLSNNLSYFIPNREIHGYGLSAKALLQIKKLHNKKPLIITVDNGITSAKLIAENKATLDFVIIDHHQPLDATPSTPTLHNNTVCATTLSWLVSCILARKKFSLDLVSIATICDQMQLSNSTNRSLVLYGLKDLQKTTRSGLLALSYLLKIDIKNNINTYHINFLIGPRINSAGRIASAETALALILETNPQKASKLAQKLDDLNQTRRQLTQTAFEESLSQVNSSSSIIVVASHSFHEGVLGLIATKITEKFKRPCLAIKTLDKKAKGSARSIHGLDITALLRQHSSLFTSLGGHAGAAGFSLKTDNLASLKKIMTQAILDTNITDELKIDIQLHKHQKLSNIWRAIEKLSPFGNGFPEPVISLRKLRLINAQSVGKEQNHLRLSFALPDNTPLNVIAFNQANKYDLSNESYDIAGHLTQNHFNNQVSLQIQLIDMHKSL